MSEQSDSVQEVVYVIGNPGSRTVKIGRTANIQKRLADIQRMSPVPLEVMWSGPGGIDLEYGLHGHFAAARTHGEWFHFKDTDPAQTVAAAVENGDWEAALAARPPRTYPRRPEWERNELERREQVALEELDALTAAFKEAEAIQDAARQELHAAIIRHLRDRNATPGKVSEHTPYDRNHVGRIAKAAGVPPLRGRVSARSDT